MPQSDALQVSQGEGGSKQKEIHSTSVKDAFLWVCQVMRFTVSLGTQQSNCHLKQFSMLTLELKLKTKEKGKKKTNDNKSEMSPLSD